MESIVHGLFAFLVPFVIFLLCELAYFVIADHFNIIDKPNERSSHSSIVLRGGGIIFPISVVLLSVFMASVDMDSGYVSRVWGYWIPFLVGLLMVAVVSFVDDIRSLPDSVRLVVQFVAVALMMYAVWTEWFMAWGPEEPISTKYMLFVLGASAVMLIVLVGAMNVINFMDGINGITGAYALSVLIPLLIMEERHWWPWDHGDWAEMLIATVMVADAVFLLFNFRPLGKAKCFAGDVGSISMAFILLYLTGRHVVFHVDPSWLIFLLVYGVDGLTTIAHRIKLHEKLGQAHRKHTFQLMANELKMSPITVSLIYAGLQLVISLGYIYLCSTRAERWIYLLCALLAVGGANLWFRKKYYHLHEEWLASLKK